MARNRSSPATAPSAGECLRWQDVIRTTRPGVPPGFFVTAGYLAGMLRERVGVRVGERVAILKQNHFDVHLLIAGIVRAGGIACPLNAHFEAANVGPYLDNIGAKVLFTDASTLERLMVGRRSSGFRLEHRDRRPHGRPVHRPEKRGQPLVARIAAGGSSHVDRRGARDAAAGERRLSAAAPKILSISVHSSGTTGFPKAVILRNGAQSHAVRGWLCYVHLSRTRDRGYVAVPNNHQAVILTFNSSLLFGLPVHWDSSYGLTASIPAGSWRHWSEADSPGISDFPSLIHR